MRWKPETYLRHLTDILRGKGMLSPDSDPEGRLAAAVDTISAALGGGSVSGVAHSGGNTAQPQEKPQPQQSPNELLKGMMEDAIQRAGVTPQGMKGTTEQGQPGVFAGIKLKPEEAQVFASRVLNNKEDPNTVLNDMRKYATFKDDLSKMTEDATSGNLDMYFTRYQKQMLDDAAASGASEDELMNMMLRFKMLNDYSDPNSEYYGKLSDGSLRKHLDEREQQRKDTRLQEVTNAMKRYAAPMWLQILQGVAAAGGATASAIGNNSQSYRHNLARAMMNAANAGTPGLSAERKAAFGDPLEGAGYLGTAKALKQQHIGNRNKIIGDTINMALNAIVGNISAEHMQQRQLRTLLEERPSGAYFQTAWQQAKHANELGRNFMGGYPASHNLYL